MKKETEKRTCTRCEEEKELSEYYSDGRSLCIQCERETARSRMSRYNKTLRGKAAQALASSRKTIKRNGYNVKDDLTLMGVIFTFAMAEGECSYCGKVTEEYHMEHIVSLAKDGPNTLSNITVACKSCNSSKSNRDLLDWREYDEVVEVIQTMATRRGVNIEEVLGTLRHEQRALENGNRMDRRLYRRQRFNAPDRTL